MRMKDRVVLVTGGTVDVRMHQSNSLPDRSRGRRRVGTLDASSGRSRGAGTLASSRDGREQTKTRRGGFLMSEIFA